MRSRQARPSNRFAYTPAPHPPPTAVNGQNDPTTPTPQPLPGITRCRFLAYAPN
jgi:hypothetical protein